MNSAAMNIHAQVFVQGSSSLEYEPTNGTARLCENSTVTFGGDSIFNAHIFLFCKCMSVVCVCTCMFTCVWVGVCT